MTEKRKAYMRQWVANYRLNNSEKVQKRCRQWYRRNIEKCRHKAKLRMTKYRQKNREQINKKVAEWRLRVKLEIFDNYGGRKCCLCNECRIGALHVDHIDGNGLEHRRSINCLGGVEFYQWIRKNNFPPGFRVLCSNCNYKEYLRKLYLLGAVRYAYRAIIKITMMNKLGGKCNNCSKSDIDILTVHHALHNGAEHRRISYKNSETFYRSIIKSDNYDGLECLCFSCNDDEEWKHRKAKVA